MDDFYTPTPPPTSSEPEQPGSGVKAFLSELLQTILISVLLYLGINAITTRISVLSISMQPTLYEKDRVLVNRIVYKFETPRRGDVVVFKAPPDPNGEPFIKRLIGLPGETVRISGGQVYINDEPLKEPYIKAAPRYSGVWKVPEDSIFVLGDNRNSSFDSHQWGVVPMKDILGRAEFVYAPFTHWQLLNPHTAAAAEP
jgi:signal peptidase I